MKLQLQVIDMEDGTLVGVVDDLEQYDLTKSMARADLIEQIRELIEEVEEGE